MAASDHARPLARRFLLRAGATTAVLATAGCNSFLPSSGPRMEGVVGPATARAGDPGPNSDPSLHYAVLTLDPGVVAAAEADGPGKLFSAGLQGQGAAEVRFGTGDILAITIFETQAGGLFIPVDAGTRPGNFITLPQQQVGRTGMVTIPFAGTVPAVGRTAGELERAIAGRLRQRALEPQVIVSLVERRSANVSVVGDVDQSLRFSLDPGGERLLGAIARAGGTRFAPHETLVTLQRGGVSESAIMAEIVDNPRLNLQLAPDDTIIVSRQQRYFLALGAVGQSASITQLNRRFPFDDRHISLADAVARAGGLQDDRANPSAVFLFRFEHRPMLERMGVATAAFQGNEIPTVYRADLLNPSSMFLTQRFPMRHNDLIFVSNAPSTDLLKFLQVLLPIAQTGYFAAGMQ
ncbi:polysaccharide biosynthesis/export family protein [Roseicella frigidaeris]|uniref:Polysaccharide export protein n=1 Tax=Roseicella frigidaeris TaxID=2230885 RepID=A0A327MBX7_9PROT|nr:polysaccharide biosynthesis/export family protein [Roseicella frigidaeris]RAI60097.1 polysaccharide export protein [Roseicella frigidaeris]